MKKEAKKIIAKGMKVMSKFGQKFTVRSVEFACIVLSNGEHVPTSVANNDYTIIED